MKPNDPVKERKPYQKPEATRFALRPEEAVLGGCKTVTSGPAHNPTAHCGQAIIGCPSAAS
jgi:hypothetical protein